MRSNLPRRLLLAVLGCLVVGTLLWGVVLLSTQRNAPGGGTSGTGPERPATDVPAGEPAGVSEAGGPPGTISGRVLFAGRRQTFPPGGGQLWDILVYLKGPGLDEALPRSAAPSEEPQNPPRAVLDQFDMMFVPHVVALPQGGVLELRNSDTTLHNMHGLARLNQSFNTSLSPQGSTEVALSRHEFIRVVCNYHPQMNAWVVVVPNRFFTRLDEEGRFSLSGIPAGEYDLVGWRESSYPPYQPHLTSTRIRIKPDETTQVELNFP